MTTYWIDPKNPLLFRDGRAFGATDRAETLPFPLPSTLIGAIRSAYGETENLDFASAKDQVMKFAQKGPLLACRSWGDGKAKDGKIQTLFPKPADAIYFEKGEELRAIRLAPAELSLDEGTDLPYGLMAAFLRGECKGKPATGQSLPALWSLDTLADWLADDGNESLAVEKQSCLQALPKDIRSHVAIDAGTYTNADGQLFQTTGLDFGPRRFTDAKNPQQAWEAHRYGLLTRVAVDGGEEAIKLPQGFRTVGGERRLAWIELCVEENDPWPAMPAKLKDALRRARGLRLTLVTPALFQGGWRPSNWLDNNLEGAPPGCSGLKLKLRAVAMDRWQAFSGWDLRVPTNRQKPNHCKTGAARAVRRMVPAGAVYWFEILPNERVDEAKRLAILESLWLASICDQEHDRRDGFGLAVPGVWTPPSHTHE